MNTKHSRKQSGLFLVLLTFSAVILGVASLATAQTRSFAEGPVVRRLRLYRSNKVELTPSIATTFGPVFRREALVGVSGRYHLTNAFSLGLTARGGVGMNGPVMRNLEENTPLLVDDVSVSHQLLVTDFNFSYIPIHGKFNLLSNKIYHFDFHINAGAGGALRSSDNDQLSGFRFGPAFGGGIRIFYQDAIAINFEIMDYMYSSLDAVYVDNQEADNQMGHHVLGTVGIGLFFPPEVRVSR